ncbi:hypothetical protein DM01DRAFT_1333626 [Hesseltinella vesiculosa]|uniref:Uncharacterized protein n=1 Tax=Hesseltinella vesiculosa TaxID=101127 RepID=A0A1X2GQG3_9FUNG|nr:hypothetical protein DM01DRAFT_1333626 [Hesseltinella vesiculosa]
MRFLSCLFIIAASVVLGAFGETFQGDMLLDPDYLTVLFPSIGIQFKGPLDVPQATGYAGPVEATVDDTHPIPVDTPLKFQGSYTSGQFPDAVITWTDSSNNVVMTATVHAPLTDAQDFHGTGTFIHSY